MNIRTDLIVRVSVITAVFSILSFLIESREKDIQALPILFVVFGVVVLISILFDINRFHVLNPKEETT